jgi:hypothetical protein
LREELEQRGADAQECGFRAVTRGLLFPCARKTLEGRGRIGRPNIDFSREHPQQQAKREQDREAGPKVVGGESLGGA